MNTVVEVDKQIDVKAYVTEEGVPTCAKDFTCGKFCRFLGTKNFGLNDVCMLSSQTRLLRREKRWGRETRLHRARRSLRSMDAGRD